MPYLSNKHFITNSVLIKEKFTKLLRLQISLKHGFTIYLMKLLFYFKCKPGVPNFTTNRTTGCLVKKA